MADSRVPQSETELKKEDFISDQMVKWCPGCGSHFVLSSVASVFARLGYRKENVMVVSGIGCSSRFPYYVNTYGFHSIHGRPAAIATGLKVSRPDLSLWVISGDGDSLAIGGNHFIHLVRRNVDLNLMLFNNQIYGLTKGQFSPTSPKGVITKTSPQGTVERPFNAGSLVVGANGTFFARVPDNNVPLIQDVLYQAEQHRGASIVEMMVNCVIFNDKAYGLVTNKDTRDDYQLILKAGEPMIFGKNKDKGIRINHGKLEVVTIGENGITLNDILVHNPALKDPFIHMMLSQMSAPEFPIALGVIRAVPGEISYDELVNAQIADARTNSSIKCVADLLSSGDVFEVK
jgi:2-oxoglutarate/2-oxoacid ferredoxin oxidoreductase subunit beta